MGAWSVQHILLPVINRFDQTESDISFFLTHYSFLGEGRATQSLVNTAHHILSFNVWG